MFAVEININNKNKIIMKVTSEINLNRFEFWSGAVSSKNRFSWDEMEQLEAIMEDLQEEWEETQINDLFWFEPEILCEWLDIDYDEWIERGDDYYFNS